MSAEALIILVVVGVIAGWASCQIVRGYGYGLIGSIIVGIVGAFEGGWLLPRLGIQIGSGLIGQIITATIGAVVLLLILTPLRRRTDRSPPEARNNGSQPVARNLKSQPDAREQRPEVRNVAAGKIFVSYRRDDVRDQAARIRDRLAATFGPASVFMDVDDLVAGQRFDKELERALAQTDVLLAVIGSRWMELFALRQASGERDFVREEIAGALARGILIIPLSIDRTPLPREAELPEDVRPLVLHQKHDVTYERFGRDIEDLFAVIRAGLKLKQTSRRSSAWITAATFGAVKR
jgi:uncharacterized membrane protein YeaQ/YmgE (transglycosylase-associated protein family)